MEFMSRWIVPVSSMVTSRVVSSTPTRDLISATMPGCLVTDVSTVNLSSVLSVSVLVSGALVSTGVSCAGVNTGACAMV